MKTLSVHFLAAIVSGSLLLTFETRAESLTNGDFELFTAGIPNGWTYAGDTPAALASSIVSPFNNVYPVSTESVHFIDGISNAGPSLLQSFSPANGIVHFGMDFMLVQPTGSPWVVNFTQSFNILVLNCLIGDGGLFRLTDASGIFTYPLVQTNWYQVSVDFNFNTERYSGSITPASPFGGTAASWLNRSLNFGTNLIRVGIGDFAAPASGEMFVDNVTVQVPEPALMSLAVLIPMILAARWRKG